MDNALTELFLGVTAAAFSPVAAIAAAKAMSRTMLVRSLANGVQKFARQH